MLSYFFPYFGVFPQRFSFQSTVVFPGNDRQQVAQLESAVLERGRAAQLAQDSK